MPTQQVSAHDIMTENPTVIDVTATIAEAIEVLNSLEIRHLPVMRGTNLVGMLSERDTHNLYGETRENNTVDRIMNSNVISVAPGTALLEVADTLLENRIGAVPVIDPHSEELLGIVSYVDVLRDLVRSANQ
jgi:acetoin utilization protein AcuB